MADNLDDGEFWLPPQFLSDENDKSFDQKMIKHTNSFFGVRNDDIFNSISRSIVPYLSSSSETDSEEEEHIAELTRQFALSTLEVDLNSEKPKPKKDVIGGGSPQSTLSALESSGKGSSPDGAVLDVNSQNETFDLLSAAAGEMEKMRLNENNVFGNGSICTNNNNNSSKSNQPKPSPVNVNNHSKSNKTKPTPVNVNVNAKAAVNAAGVGLSFYPQPQPLQQQMQQQMQQPSLSQQQLQVAQFGMMRPVQRVMQRQMVPNRGRNKNNMNIINNHNNVGRGLSGSAWPPPLQNGGGMRAVFIPGNRESAGTGVFLPRSVETRNQPHKKSGCKTALVPARVMQALNLKKSVVAAGNLQQQQHNQQPQCFNGGNGSAVARGCGNNKKNNQNYGVSLQKVNNVNPPQVQVVNQEIQLPQEWTY